MSQVPSYVQRTSTSHRIFMMQLEWSNPSSSNALRAKLATIRALSVIQPLNIPICPTEALFFSPSKLILQQTSSIAWMFDIILTTLSWISCDCSYCGVSCFIRNLQAPMHPPTVIHITIIRLCFSNFSTPVLQFYAPGRRSSTPIFTSLKDISQFSTILKGILFLIFNQLTPCFFMSRMAPLTSLPSLAQTTKQSLFPFPIHRLRPLRRQVSAWLVRVVQSWEALEPIFGSVRAHPHIFLRLIRSGRQAACCSVDPSCWMVFPTRGACNMRKVANPMSNSASVETMSPWPIRLISYPQGLPMKYFATSSSPSGYIKNQGNSAFSMNSWRRFDRRYLSPNRRVRVKMAYVKKKALALQEATDSTAKNSQVVKCRDCFQYFLGACSLLSENS